MGDSENVHQVTSRLYGALADHLVGGQDDVRREAVAILSAILGVVLMFALRVPAFGVGRPQRLAASSGDETKRAGAIDGACGASAEPKADYRQPRPSAKKTQHAADADQWGEDLFTAHRVMQSRQMMK